QRGVDAEVAKAFRLGYAPADWHALERALGQDAKAIEALRAAGLVVVREDGRHYDRFRERLMFPIADSRGQVVGFGGRALAARQEPKYLNSPESPVYQKSRILYGLDRAAAAIRRSGRAVVVEGYMDVLAMHQFGLAEAVATCGTALTASHGRALMRLARQVIVAFDSDAAGQSGALRGLAQLRAAGLDVRVAVLPEPHDPDSLLKSEGRPAMEAVLEEARGVYEFAVEQALRGVNLETPAGKAAAVANVLPILLDVPGAVEQEALVAQVATRVHVSERAIRREMERELRRRRAGVRGGARGGRPHGYNLSVYNSKGPYVQSTAAGNPGVSDQGSVVERELLRLLVEMPELAERVRGRLAGNDFTARGYGTLFDALMAQGEGALADPELAEVAGRVLGSSEVAVRPDALDSYVKGLRQAARQRELAAIEGKVGEAARSGGAPGERLVRLAELAVLYREVWERLRSERIS
ncbi:MAG: toprim domain-containing protein, partial [Bacillota bacterium]